MGAAMQTAESQPLTFLTTRDVLSRIGMSRSSLANLRKRDPSFPEPIKFGDGTGRQVQLRWVEHELEEWMRRLADSRQQ